MRNNGKFYHIITYGCQMNEHDSEKLAGMLEDMGYKYTDKQENADIILLNTCIIRENAELKLFGKVGSLKPLKRQNPDLIIGIGGCMMQTDEAVQEIRQKYDHVDIVFGTHNIHKLPELINKANNENKVFEVWEKAQGLIPETSVQREDDHKAWVSIIQGCDNFCSYCIVPYVRGRERSRPPEAIISETKDLIGEGIKEITLLGQNVNSYGKDLEQDIDFADLLQKIDKIDGLARIRYMTSHPRDFSEKMVNVVTNCESVCEHFHLPIQSGSDPVLKKMNRGYTVDEYKHLINSIREKIPGASITTDFIVGFPGETEADFKATLELIKEIRFDMAFTFAYSPRSGTPAAKMDNQVEESVKKQRLHKIMEVQNKISKEINKELEGQIVRVLIEGESKNNPDNFSGRTRTNKLVIIPARKGLKGKIIKVKINNAQSWTLYGEEVKQ